MAARSAIPAQAVLALDVDGVLLDPTGGGRGGWQQVLEERYAVDAGRLRSAFFERTWPEVIVGRRPVEPALAAAIGELGWPMTVEDLLACWFEADFTVDNEVVDVVRAEADAGVRLVLVTNQEHRRARFLEERLGSLIPISGIAYSAAIGFVKEDPRFFPVASEQLGISGGGGRVVFVDDSPVNVAAARGYGWSDVHFTREGSWRDDIMSALASRR
jgi:putative hydrolase of the HAD superfamily